MNVQRIADKRSADGAARIRDTFFQFRSFYVDVMRKRSAMGCRVSRFQSDTLHSLQQKVSFPIIFMNRLRGVLSSSFYYIIMLLLYYIIINIYMIICKERPDGKY